MKINTLFDFSYGTKLDLNKMEIVSNDDSEGINFIGRTANNLGIVTKVKKLKNTDPISAGSITVALGGSILSSFVQQEPFYTAQNIMILTPKQKMLFKEKIFYCLCISENRFRYSTFGREANRTIKNLELPDKIPNWIYSKELLQSVRENMRSDL